MLSNPSHEVWDYNRLIPVQRLVWDAMARDVERGNLFTLCKFMMDKSLLVARVHEPVSRFLMAPVLGEFSLKGMTFPTDFDQTLPPIPRGDMSLGNPLGPPYRYETRVSADSPSNRQLLILPRDTFKTTFLESYIVMHMLRNPNVAILVSGRDDARANAIVGAIEQEIDSNPKLMHYWHTDTWHKFAKERGLTWTIERKYSGARTQRREDPTLHAVPLGALKPGGHYDVVILDDIIDNTVMASDELSAKVDEMFDLIAPMLGPKSIMVVTGTFWSSLDLYSSLLKQKTRSGRYMYDAYVRDSVLPNGRLWFPERKSEDVLLTAHDAAARRGQLHHYWSQQRSQPVSAAEDALEVDKIHEFEGAPPKDLRVILSVDAADENARGDTGAWALWCIGTDADHHLWDVELVKGRIRGDKALAEALRMIRQHSVRVVIVENVAIARRWIVALQQALVEEGLASKVAVDTVEHNNQAKRYRIKQVENSIGMVIAQGRLHVNKHSYSVWIELRTFPEGNYTYDALDSGSYASVWIAKHGFYPRKVKEEVRRDIDPYLARFHASCDEALRRRDLVDSGGAPLTWDSSGIFSW